jgi:1,4-alpha-glucan branching enzyme
MATGSWWRPISAAEIEAIVSGRHADPFAVLGLHQAGDGWVARAFVPGASALEVLSPGGQSLAQLELRHQAGFFEGPISAGERRPLVYRARNSGGEWTVEDAYLLGPVLGPLDDYYIGEGNHLRLYDRLGAHPMQHEGHDGVHFAVWAPNASRVSVVGDFNGWDGRAHVMRKRRDTGVWEIFIPGAAEGHCYKYELLDARGKLLPLKSDPIGICRRNAAEDSLEGRPH